MEPAVKGEEYRVSRAYRCFGFLGLVTLPLGLAALLQALGLMNFGMGTIGKDSQGVGETLTRWAFVIGLFLGLPILGAMLAASVYGIRQTVRFRSPALVVLAIVSIVFWGGTMVYVPILDEPGHPYLEYGWDIGGGIYVAANVLIPAWWFTKGRRHYRSKGLARE